MVQDAMDWAESHPFMLAILIFLIFFVGFQFLKGRQTSSQTTPPTTGTTPTGTGDTFINVYRQYPITGTGTPGPPGHPGPPGPPGPKPKKPPDKDHKDDDDDHSTSHPHSSARFVTVQPFPNQLSSLDGIAQHVGRSLSFIKNLNPQYHNNWDLVYAGQKVRVS